MTGFVSYGEILMHVTFRLQGQPDMIFQFLVDTGFTGYLALPPAAVDTMRLPFSHPGEATLADGRVLPVTVHQATIAWDDAERVVQVFATGRRPLLGTKLLDGHDVRIEFTEGGRVSIEPLQHDAPREA